MTEEQRVALLNILMATWHREMSADDALELVEDLVCEVRAEAMITVDPMRARIILENEQNV